MRRIHERCFAMKARSAARRLERRYDAALKPHGIGLSQFSLLTAAEATKGKATISDIAAALGLDRSTLSRTLAALEQRGLLRLGAETRHRARHVEITPQGRALLSEAERDWERVQSAIEARLGSEASAAEKALARLSDAAG